MQPPALPLPARSGSAKSLTRTPPSLDSISPPAARSQGGTPPRARPQVAGSQTSSSEASSRSRVDPPAEPKGRGPSPQEAETGALLGQGRPPRAAQQQGQAGLDPLLAGWWEGRWRRHTASLFAVYARLWWRVHRVEDGELDINAAYSAALGAAGDHPHDLADQVTALQALLGRKISSAGARSLMTEIDEHRDGRGDGHVDRREALRWWAQLTDDARAMEQAWAKVDTTGGGSLGERKLAELVQELLSPSDNHARLAIWASAAWGNVQEEPGATPDQVGAWLTQRSVANANDRKRVQAFLTESSTMPSVFTGESLSVVSLLASLSHLFTVSLFSGRCAHIYRSDLVPIPLLAEHGDGPSPADEALRSRPSSNVDSSTRNLAEERGAEGLRKARDVQQKEGLNPHDLDGLMSCLTDKKVALQPEAAKTGLAVIEAISAQRQIVRVSTHHH